MASLVNNFNQVLLTYQEIARANPKWSAPMVEDYLSLKRDLASSANATDAVDDTTTELERRVLGETRPAVYSPLLGYSKGEFVIQPAGVSNQYFYARQTILAPAGVFNPVLWDEVSLIDNFIETIRLAQRSVELFTFAGYGGLTVGTPIAMSDINSTWQTVVFDTGLLTNPRHIVQDVANDALAFGAEGVWAVDITMALTFVSTVIGRQIQVRLYDLTTATPSSGIGTFFSGRNQDGVNISISVLTDVLPAQIGDLLQLQINSAADTFTGVTNISTFYQASHVSQYVGDL